MRTSHRRWVRPLAALTVAAAAAAIGGCAQQPGDGVTELNFFQFKGEALEDFNEIIADFEAENQRWREEWLDGTPEELLQRRLKRTLERYEDFYGRLDPAQRSLLRARLASSGFDPRLAWAERQRRQQDILRVLQEHRSGDRPAHIKAETATWAGIIKARSIVAE